MNGAVCCAPFYSLNLDRYAPFLQWPNLDIA